MLPNSLSLLLAANLKKEHMIVLSEVSISPISADK